MNSRVAVRTIATLGGEGLNKNISLIYWHGRGYSH